MDSVALAVLVVVVVVVGGIVAKLTWRSERDDLHSVDHYRSALGTIAEIRERTARSGVRIVDPEHPGAHAAVTPVGPATDPRAGAGDGGEPDGAAAGGATPLVDRAHGAEAPEVPQGEADGRRRHAGAGTPLVFDDTAPAGPVGAGAAGTAGTAGEAGGTGDPGDGFRSPRAKEHALHSMNHRSRHAVPVATAAVAVVAIAAAALFASRAVGHGHPTSSRATVTTSRGRGSGTAPAKHHHGHPSSSTTTTAPPQVAPASVGAGGTTARYSVPGSGPFTVTVAASEPCWIDATEASSGSVLWTGTLHAGGSQSVQSSGTLSLELGAPGATLTVDGTPVSFPAGMHTPFVATFVPSGSGGASSTAG
jgi:hypothetical protein